MKRKSIWIALLLALCLMFSIVGCTPAEEDPDPDPDPEPSVTYTVTLTAGTGGTVSGGGTYESGKSVTVTATADDGYEFVGWFEGTELVSAEASYTFTVTANVAYNATFAEINELEAADYTNGINGSAFGFADRTDDAGENWWDGLSSLGEDTYFAGLQSDVKVAGSDEAYAVMIDALDPDGDGTGRYPETTASGMDTWNRIDAWLSLDLTFEESEYLSESIVSVDVKAENFSWAFGFNAADGTIGATGTNVCGEKWGSFIAGANANGAPETFLDYVKVDDIGDGWYKIQINMAGVYASSTVLETVRTIRFLITTQTYGVDSNNANTIDYTKDMAIWFDNLNIIEAEEPADAEDITVTATDIVRNATAEEGTYTAHKTVKTDIFAVEGEAAYFAADGTQSDLVVTIPLGYTLALTEASFNIYVFDEAIQAPSFTLTVGESAQTAQTAIGWKQYSVTLAGVKGDSLKISLGELNGYVLISDVDYTATEQFIEYGGVERTFGEADAAYDSPTDVLDTFTLLDGMTEYHYSFTIAIDSESGDTNETNANLRTLSFFANENMYLGGIVIKVRYQAMLVYIPAGYVDNMDYDHDPFIIATNSTTGATLENNVNLTLTIEYSGNDTIITFANTDDPSQIDTARISGKKLPLGSNTVGAYCPAGCYITIS